MTHDMARANEAVANSLEELAKRRGASMAQVSLAWLMSRSGMLPSRGYDRACDARSLSVLSSTLSLTPKHKYLAAPPALLLATVLSRIFTGLQGAPVQPSRGAVIDFILAMTLTLEGTSGIASSDR